MASTKCTTRGTGTCSSCQFNYTNRHKPEKCPKCHFYLGGKSKSAKKPKLNHPEAVLIADNIFSVRTSNQGDRCFVCKDNNMWICLHDKCKERRASYYASGKLEQFSCDHIKKALNPVSPLASYSPQESNLCAYACSGNMKAEITSLMKVAEDSRFCMVSKVSDNMYVVCGPPTASNTIGFCNVKHFDQNHPFFCTGKDCRGLASKGKQARTKAVCIHLHILFCTLNVNSDAGPSKDVVPSVEDVQVLVDSEEDKLSLSRSSTLRLAEKELQLPYVVDRELLQKILKQDACSLSQMPGGWPEKFSPTDIKCRLCQGDLSGEVQHSGQSGPAYLISELNAFKRCEVQVKVCQNQKCKAMNCALLQDFGLFNISDKVLVTFDILLEFREHFKKGHPIGNVIDAKLASLTLKCKQELVPSPSEITYIAQLLYNGFYCHEMLVDRDLDSVICGLCGICPEVCLGDGSEKNSCSNKKIHYPADSSQLKEMLPMTEFLIQLRNRWIEKTVYTRCLKAFSISVEEFPPFIAPGLSGNEVVNTEIEKKSIYLTKETQGDPACVYALISQGKLDMGNVRNCTTNALKEMCTFCKIPVSRKSKEQLIGSLQAVYSSILVGNSPCHGFSKIPGRTGGYYHIVCRHGCTVASKFLALTESVRDAADLYMSIKYQPTVFINDTPCGFARHLRCRKPEMAKALWGDNEGCFEKPTLEKLPTSGHCIPEMITPEFKTTNPVESTIPLRPFQHPATMSNQHFVLGDRFHNNIHPHKSPLCLYHDVNLASGSNTLKTSIQESQNFRKNARRLRSAGQQHMEVHIAFNFLMDFYQNEEIVLKQLSNLQQALKPGEKIIRNKLLRFVHVD